MCVVSKFFTRAREKLLGSCVTYDLLTQNEEKWLKWLMCIL